MRKLMWFTVGFALSCTVGLYFLYGKWIVLMFPFLIFAVISLFFIKRKTAGKIFCLCLGSLLGVCWLYVHDGWKLEPIRSLDGYEIWGEAEISDYSNSWKGGCSADGFIDIEGVEYRVRIFDSSKNFLLPGDKVSGNFLMRYTGPGSDSNSSYHQGKGVFLLLYSQKDTALSRPNSMPNRYTPARIRKYLNDLLENMYGNVSEFATALLLGDTSDLPYALDNNLRISGIRHIVAVSGLHVTMLFGMIYFLCGKKPGITALIGIPLLILFSAIAGFTPSIVRACAMQSLFILALVFNKEYDPPTALSFSVLVLLGLNPMVLTSVSFQLSVGCIIGIFTVSGKIQKYFLSTRFYQSLKGRKRFRWLYAWLTGSISVTLGAMLFTLPLSAYYFGSFSIVGILTNIASLWAVSISFSGLLLSCALGAIWLPLGRVISIFVRPFLNYCVFSAEVFSRFPFAAVYTGNIYQITWVIFAYGLLLAFVLFGCKKKKLFLVSLFSGLLFSSFFLRAELRADLFRVTVVDVGQGQSVILHSKGLTYLVDCGGEYSNRAADSILNALANQGIRRLDGIILTHYDSDHINALDGVMHRLPAKNLYLPDTYDDNGFRKIIQEKYQNTITWVTQVSEIQLKKGKITLLPGTQGEGDNESGLCVLFQSGEYDILITGDRGISGENALMQQIKLPKLELLVAGHHGSKNSTGFALLKATQPDSVAISSGRYNPYGHPSDETLERLRIFDCQIYRTDLEGNLVFRG